MRLTTSFAECWVLLCCQWSASPAEVWESHAGAHGPRCSCTCSALSAVQLYPWKPQPVPRNTNWEPARTKARVKSCGCPAPAPSLSHVCFNLGLGKVTHSAWAAGRRGKTGGVRLGCLGSDTQCRTAGLHPSQSSSANCSAPSSSSQFLSHKCPWVCLLFLFQLAPTLQKNLCAKTKKRFFLTSAFHEALLF